MNATNKSLSLEKAKELAFNLLERKSMSKREMATALKKRGVSDEHCAEIVAYLAEIKYLDDVSFARSLAVKLLRDKLYAPDRARYEMLKRGVDKELADKILKNIKYDMDAAVSLIIQKYAGKKNVKKEKIAAALNRNGFRYDEYASLLREYEEAKESEDE